MNFTLRTKADNSMQQVQTCLNVLVNCERMIQQGGSEPGKAEVTIDGEVRTSIEATMVRACNRLDKILDEDSRWEDIPCVVEHTNIAMTLENQIKANDTVRDNLQLLLGMAHKQRMQAMSQGIPFSIIEAQIASKQEQQQEQESPATAPEQTQRRKKGKK